MKARASSRGRRRLGCVAAAAGCGALVLGGCGGESAALEAAPIEAEVVIGEPGRAPGQFSYPRAIESLGDGLLVIDKTARVQYLASDGAFRLGFDMPESDLGKPTGVTVGAHPFEGGRQAVYIADTHYQRVLVFDAGVFLDGSFDGRMIETPEPILSFGSYGWGDGELIYPTDVGVLASTDDEPVAERLYVSEYGGNDRVSVYEIDRDARTARFAFSFGVQGSGAGTIGSSADVEFNRPQAILVNDTAGELVISDACNHRIGRFSLDGELIGWIGGEVSGEPDRFMYPYGLTAIGDGQMLVSEFGHCRVHQLEIATGRTVATYGQPGRRLGELAMPWAIAISDGLAFVLDSGNNRVLGFEVRGGVRLSRSDGPQSDGGRP